MKNLIFTLLSFLLFSTVLLGQDNFRDTLSTDFPFLHMVEIEANVTVSQDFYMYKYSIASDIQNKGIIISFRISLKDSLSYIPDTTGLIFKNSYVEYSFRNIYDLIESIAVPAGFPTSPGRWTGHFSKFGEAGFSGSPVIEPGDSLSGFVMQSRGLPRVREITVYPRFDVSEFFQSLEDPNLTQTFAEMDSLRNMVNYYGLTIGPWLPDSTMSLEAFTDTLETFRFRSCEELGWANDTTVCGELEDQLSDVKTFLSTGDSLSAANTLQEFIELVEAEKDQSLTSEGYALLYFNGIYLADRLPEPQPSDGKVTLCHKPGTPAHKTLLLPAQALNGHLGHGDTQGACETNSLGETPDYELLPSDIVVIPLCRKNNKKSEFNLVNNGTVEVELTYRWEGDDGKFKKKKVKSGKSKKINLKDTGTLLVYLNGELIAVEGSSSESCK